MDSKCLYNELYLSTGFTLTGDPSCPVWLQQTIFKFFDGSSKTKMVIHEMKNKNVDYFRLLLEFWNKVEPL